MPMPVACLGFSYRNAPIQLREQLNCPLRRLAELGSRHACLKELVRLATCHRIELYGCGDADADTTESILVELLGEAQGIDANAFRPYMYQHTGREAVRHLCRVAAGLDSMVLGEPQ